MNDYEKKCDDIIRSINFIKSFCVICSKRNKKCDDGCEYGTILKALDLMAKLEGIQDEN